MLSAPLAWGQTVVFLDSEEGDYIGGGVERTFHPGNGVFSAFGREDGGYVGIRYDGEDGFFRFEFVAPEGEALAPGSYPNAARFPFQSPTQPGLDASGGGRGCNRLSGTFNVFEVELSEDEETGDPVVDSFAANFEQHCEEGEPALFGFVRYNSSLPIPLPGTGEIVAHIEGPGCEGAAGTSNIRGVVYTTEPGEEIQRLVDVTFDMGTPQESSITIPCCSSRGDAPVELSGFSGLFNWCLLEPGLHTVTFVFVSTTGRTLTVTREFVSYCEHPDNTFLGDGEPFDWASDGAGCASYPGGVVVCSPDPAICDGQVRYEWDRASQGLKLRSNCVEDGVAPPARPVCDPTPVEVAGSIFNTP